MTERTTPADPQAEKSNEGGHTPATAAVPAGLTALIAEAEALVETLGDARTRSARLVAALRKQRRRDRLVQTTLASLRQLKLQEAVE